MTAYAALVTKTVELKDIKSTYTNVVFDSAEAPGAM